LYELLQTVVSNSSDYNQDVNLTRALDLPKDCKLSDYSTKTTSTCHQLFIINTCPKSSAMGMSSRRLSLLGTWLLYLYLYLHLSTSFRNSEFPNFLPVKSGLMGLSELLIVLHGHLAVRSTIENLCNQILLGVFHWGELLYHTILHNTLLIY
jgi:hypothetical protein